MTYLLFAAVRADRMRGGRNKFGPMYKRDRARKLQLMRQRQMASQSLRNSLGNDGSLVLGGYCSGSAYPSMPIKQEIQIPQVSSLTSSPDSSPSPATVALGQASHASLQNLPVLQNPSVPQMDKSCYGPNSTTRSPHSVSPESFNFDGSASTTTTAEAGSTTETLRLSPIIRVYVVQLPSEDREWQTLLFDLLQNLTYNQCVVDDLELLSKVLDQKLFALVDWARNTVFFKDLKVSLVSRFDSGGAPLSISGGERIPSFQRRFWPIIAFEVCKDVGRVHVCVLKIYV